MIDILFFTEAHTSGCITKHFCIWGKTRVKLSSFHRWDIFKAFWNHFQVRLKLFFTARTAQHYSHFTANAKYKLLCHSYKLSKVIVIEGFFIPTETRSFPRLLSHYFYIVSFPLSLPELLLAVAFTEVNTQAQNNSGAWKLRVTPAPSLLCPYFYCYIFLSTLQVESSKECQLWNGFVLQTDGHWHDNDVILATSKVKG